MSNYTLKSLSERVNTPVEKLASRVKLAGKMAKAPAEDDSVPDEIANNIIAAFDAIKAKQNVIALPEAGADVAPNLKEQESGELTRVTNVKDIRAIAQQFGVTQALVKDLEEAAYWRNLELVFELEQVKYDNEKRLKEAVRLTRTVQDIQQEEARLDEVELELLDKQDEGRLEKLDDRFGLGLQGTIAEMKAESDRRTEAKLNREKWLKDLEAGAELPEEAYRDPFVNRAFSRKTA